MRYFLSYFLPGCGMIVLAFFAGGQKNLTLGLLSFLCFFVVGVALIIEGRKRLENKK